MARRPGQKAKLVLRSPAQVRALRTPIRWRVFAAFRALGRCSVGEIAAWLDWKAESLYYHVKALERAGLVRRVARRPSGRRHETVYEAAARVVHLDSNDRSEEYLAAVRDSYRAKLAASERELYRALEEERKGTGPRRNASLYRLTARLSPADYDKLRAMLDEIETFVLEHELQGGSPAITVTLMLSRR